MRLTISRKLLTGYLIMALLTILMGAYAISSLEGLNRLAESILNRDFLLINISRQMVEELLAQERTEKKFLILKDSSIEQLFWTRSREFEKSLDKLRKIKFPGVSKTLNQAELLHHECDTLFTREAALIKEQRFQDAASLSEGAMEEKLGTIAGQLRALQKKAEDDVNSKMNRINAQADDAARITIMLCLVSLLGGFALALFITYNISRPLKQLEKATGFIADGNFDYDVTINRNDEIGHLADRFRIMAKRLKILEKINLDASPLTRLPGNLVIEKTIEKRLAEKKPFSLCHLDLDNFKPFADNYGYAWASEIIKELAQIMSEILAPAGNDRDFIGHIGGDDFVIITEPERAEDICQQVVAEFDKHIVQFYSEKDKETGFILGKDRKGVEQKFPLITISIAIVTDDGTRFANALDMAKAAADLKEYAKTLPGSNYVKQEDVIH